MSKQTSTNTWKDGLNKDLHPSITPNTILTDNLNGTFVTYNGNELSLQNDMGNIQTTWLSDGFYPIGLTEFGDIIYIVSINDDKRFEVGSFPSLSPSIEEGEDFYGEKPFEYVYRPFLNLKRDGNLDLFSTDAIKGYDRSHPVSIEVQPSYDGSVNLILTDDKNPPRIINSGFAVIGNGNGRFIHRNQDVETNIYNEETVEQTTRLISNSTVFPKLDLEDVSQGGQLKGGNYTFYIKFGDDDGNKTDIVCESGIVSVFKGTPNSPTTISGAFANELTDKLIKLKLSNIDYRYSRIYVYYTREYCDLNGYRLVECKELIEPYKISASKTSTYSDAEENRYQLITISGVEAENNISIEELNIMYHSVAAVKTEAQQQNMLFLGNIETAEINNPELQNLSYNIIASISQSEPIGSVNVWNYTSDGDKCEYYNPKNIYYKLGYWPDELYRFGVVYIKSDGSLTQVFNLKGCEFAKPDPNDPVETNVSEGHMSPEIAEGETRIQNLSNDGVFLTNTSKSDNIYGVFKTPDINILEANDVKPMYFSFEIPLETIEKLKELDIVGYFIVRQKRIPITICQGFGVGIDQNTFIPMLQYENKFVTESFITKNAIGEDGGRQLKYTPININGDVVTNLSEDVEYQTYLYHYQWWPSFIGRKRQVVEVIGPKGQNPDSVLYSSESRIGNWEDTDVVNACKDECIQWCLRNGVVLTSTSLKTNKNVNTKLTKTKVSDDEATATYELREREIDQSQALGQGLLSVDVMTNPQLQSILCGSEFTIDPINKCDLQRNSQMFIATGYETTNLESSTSKLIYIPEETPLKYIDNVGFSTQVGDGINVNAFGFLVDNSNINYYAEDNIVRGKYTPFIGTISDTKEHGVQPNYLYNIRNKHDDNFRNDIIVRVNNSAEYYAVSDRHPLEESNIEVYRGDCFTNTVTVRMLRNFIDSTAPIADKIVKEDCWRKYYRGYNNVAYGEIPEGEENDYTQWDEINLTDLNTVSLGHWVTFKCLSNSNLGLRSEDTFNTSEMALMGTARSFYPLIGASTATKLEDSHLLNDGYNATVGRKRNTIKQDTPFDKNEFSTRIMFSNVSVNDSFTNGYRVFQGASYHDYTKQYGAIVKLVSWGNNLFCVFEHGLAMIPVNEKALMQTTTEQTIHIYGHGVLSEQLSIISQDYGSIWQDSIIRTPIGIYGVDTSAKKIWRYTDKNGLEMLSDLKLQRFLNDNINLELTRDVELGVTNVKSHYNNYKGDVMFTFYHTKDKDKKEWNLCYNERQALWVTRYSWTPLFSGNINNTFYSIPLHPYNEFGIYRHGRTGIDTQFIPNLWYGKYYPFEFEFVVNEPQGLHKIFENLVIISNNVQPAEIEFEFVGDDYLFNKARIYHDNYEIYGKYGNDIPYRKQPNLFSKDNFDITNFKPMFYNAGVNYDAVLDEYTLLIKQICKNVETYGRRRGNIQYKEDYWYTNIEPLRYNANLKDPNVKTFKESDEFVSAKLRDKWIKIRLRYYNGPNIPNRLAIINGVTTFENISYS